MCSTAFCNPILCQNVSSDQVFFFLVIPQYLLNEHDRVVSKVNKTLAPLLVPHVNKLKEALDPLLSTLTWSSIQAHSFFDKGFAAIKEFETLIDR